MTKPESPCKDCIERIFNCHSGCKKYEDYKKEQKKWADLIIKNRESSLWVTGRKEK